MGERGAPVPAEIGQGSERMPRERSWIERMDRSFGMVYDAYETNEERVAELHKRMSEFAVTGIGPDIKEQVLSNLERCLEAEDRASFIAFATDAAQPLTDYRREHFAEFQQRSREVFAEYGHFVPLNDVLHYDEASTGEIQVHLAPAEDIPNLPGVVKDGLQKLAQLFQEHPEWHTVSAQSWIVAQHPRIVERLGFTVEPAASADKPSHTATMDRETLLRLYG